MIIAQEYQQMLNLIPSFSFRPVTSTLRGLLGVNQIDLAGVAQDVWEIAPGETAEIPSVICLPNQVGRITRTEFAPLDIVVASMAGSPAEQLAPTMGYRLRDVDIVDGVLYSRGYTAHLRRRRHRAPFPGHMRDEGSGTLFETWVGNRWFGNWLLDDCLSYRLAEQVGDPVTTMPVRAGHVPRYEELLDLKPRRINNAHFDELVVFDDHANNSHRMARADDMRRRLLGAKSPAWHPGIFLFRGRSGDLRNLVNEHEIAERLVVDRGFRVMFAEDHTVDELIEACAGARVIAGVEGSQLNHGIAVMPPNGTLLTIQPADRTTTAMKLLTDRWRQFFAMVVGEGQAESFHVPWDEIARTLDLIDERQAAATKSPG